MDAVQDDVIMARSTKSLLPVENTKKRKQKVEKFPGADPLGLLQRPGQTGAERMRKLRDKQKAKDPETFLQNERKRIKELRKKKNEGMTEEEKAELRKKERERKRRQRKRLKQDADLSYFPLWIEKEIDELEKQLNVRPRRIKLWQMTEEQLEEKRKYEREKQRRQRAKIKAQKSIYDPLDLLQIKNSNEDYDDDEGSVQHLWRPDVE